MPGVEPASPRFSILAVDDERANLNLLRRTFRGDYDLYFAEDGLAGINMLRQKPVDMIITDQRMPRMTGIQMLYQSREIVPEAVRIIITAYTDVRDVIDSVNQGQIYRYVLKPWSPDELRVTVANAFKHYAVMHENRALIVRLQKSLEDLKAAQQELLNRERLSTIGRMAGTIIHDLKLPMSNIRSAASLLARNNLSAEARAQFSAIIMSEIDRQVGMTREILDFARGEMKLNEAEFHVKDLLDDVISVVDREFGEAGITMRREWEELGQIKGDRERLRRVLLNILSNAREAMHDGGTVSILGARGNDQLNLSICDTGSGIPAEIIDRVFTPFVTFGKHHGTGLGMAIAKNIIEAHGGTIAARNCDGGGASIDITLPIR